MNSATADGSEYPLFDHNHIILLDHLVELYLQFLTATVNTHALIAAHGRRAARLRDCLTQRHIRPERLYARRIDLPVDVENLGIRDKQRIAALHLRIKDRKSTRLNSSH